jgi:hypothetical protein
MLFTVGCQTSVRIATTPSGVEVSSDDKVIGETPMTVAVDKLGKEQAGGYLISMHPDGYQRVWIWIPAGVSGLDLSLNLRPFKEQSDENSVTDIGGAGSRQELYRTSALLLTLQSQILLGENYDKKQLDALTTAYPHFGGLQFLQALDLLRSNEKDKAAEKLRKALLASPKEYDFLALYNEISGGAPPPVVAAPAAKKGATE